MKRTGSKNRIRQRDVRKKGLFQTEFSTNLQPETNSDSENRRSHSGRREHDRTTDIIIQTNYLFFVLLKLIQNHIYYSF